MLKKEFKNKLLFSMQDSLKNTLVDVLFTPLPVNNINSLLSESTQTPPAIIQTPPAIIQTPPAIIKASKVNQIRHNKSIDYIKSNKNEEMPILEKINLLQLVKNTNKDVIYPNVFNFLSKDDTVPHINEYIPTQPQDLKSRKSLNLNISYGKFKKVNSGQPVYVPNHDQKIQIMNTFFGSIPPNNNLNKIYNSLNTIPSYAQGGTVKTPQLIVAGERGPESIIPEKQIKENMVSSTNQTSRTSSTETAEMPILVGLGNSKLGPIYSSSSSIQILTSSLNTEGLPKFDGYSEK
jgi:hypothetical protein